MFKISSILCIPLMIVGCNLNEVPEPALEGNRPAIAAQTTTFWVPMSWGDKEIATAQGQTLAVVTPGGSIYKWMGTYESGWWAYLGYGASKIAMLPDGNPVVTTPSGYVYRITVSSGVWDYLGFPPAREMGLGITGGIWMVSNYPYSGGDYWVGRQNSNGTWSWLGAAKEIAVDRSVQYEPRAWIVTAAGVVQQWNGWNGWITYPPSEAAAGTLATDIAVGGNNVVYVVGNDFDAQGNARVWQIAGSTWWNNADGRGVRVAVGDDQDVFITQADGTTLHHWYPH